MHARITKVQWKSDKKKEALQIVSDSIVPAASLQPGFRLYLGLTGPGADEGMSITLWETEADMLAGEKSGFYREQLSKITDLFEGTPSVEHYEVNLTEGL